MEVGIEAARWVVGRALGTASGGVLEAWAASSELGPNIRALRMELLYAQGMLNSARSRGYGDGPEIQNPALGELLRELRDQAFQADDVLDELDYFRIQDELDGTYHAADEHGGGCLRTHALNARHTARNIRKMLGFSNCSRGSADHDEPDEDDTSGRGVKCGACPCLGPKTTPDDDEQEEDAGGRGALCEAVWPCGRATPALPRPPPTNQSDQAVHAGCMARIASAASDIINTVGKRLPCYPDNSNAASPGRRFLCCARPNKAPQSEHVVQAPELKFDRVEMSRKMKVIVEQLKPLCAKVSAILNIELLDSSRSIVQCIGTSLDTWFSKGQWPAPSHRNAMMSRPITTPEFREPELYGREHEKTDITFDITKGNYCEEDLTVLPIVGPGGIGKTTLTQYIYNDDEVQSHFEVKLWVCVSVNFNVHRLTQEIADKLTNDKKDSPDKQIEEQLKSKRFLLVLDDMWDCSNEDEWKRFLLPFKKGQTKGSVILVTTRFPALAQMVKTTSHWKDLKGLDSKSFKELFRAYAFGDKQSMDDHNELQDTGDKIVEKLKGSPLAAKTVGRLLRNNFDLGHWTRVLESKEWESQNEVYDIMPALKLSFDYLPFHLQQCFTYCALFPEDYRFSREELIHFWIGLDIVHSHGENKRIEDIGGSYLTELVGHGFLIKEEDRYGYTRYVIHDLLHELGLKVSAYECLSINSSNVRSIQIPQSIRHLSINIDDSSVKDKNTFDICKEDFSVLGKRLKVENLNSLMLFGEHQGSFIKTFHGLFHKAKALRVIFISGGNYRLEDLFHNFLNLVHLRYLRVHNDWWWTRPQAPKNISRFYHMRVLDLQGCDTEDCSDLPRHLSNLLKLRHFLVQHDGMHASIFEVGQLKLLQELRRFVVRKEIKGFELRQIGHLLELCGSLSIDNLENVEGREEADEAKLMYKKHLHELLLDWDVNRSSKDPAREDQVLEGLKPHSNLVKLSIRGHGGPTCPSWLRLGPNLSVMNLQSLCLDSVSWKIFPPIGQLRLVNEDAEEISSNNILGQHFKNLKRIELRNLARLKRWVIGELLSHLEVLIIMHCPELVELSFSNSSCSPRVLQELRIGNCPKLSSLPPVPWASVQYLSNVGLELRRLEYKNDDRSLRLHKSGEDMESSFWTALDFDKLTGLEKLKMTNCPPPPLDGLRKLSTINSLRISDRNRVTSGKELTQVLCCLPKLSELSIDEFGKITGLGVVGQLKEETDEEALLLLPPQLQVLYIWGCPELSLRAENGGGLQALSSLRSLAIVDCPKFLACYLPSSSCSSGFPFPTSLQSLTLRGLEKLAPLSNLASLIELWIIKCGGSEGAGLRCLLAHGCLRELYVSNTRNLFTIECSEGNPEMLEHEPAPLSSKLQSLEMDDVAGFLAAPVCTLLSSSLTRMNLQLNEIERFTKEQDEALQLITSLQELDLSGCIKLQSLPAGLQRLTNLKTLRIHGSPALHLLHKRSLPDSLQQIEIYSGDIRSLPKDSLPNSLRRFRVFSCSSLRSLPKDGLPNSLEALEISACPSLRSLPKDGLPNSLEELKISGCPSIRGLPKGGLPSSLQLLDVMHGNSEELRRQCRTLIGTIPIVRV
ncbi:putative disease resistance protein At3g14460 isoform X3 [Panicum hallii]|uniref:putative disease resistance protein At3g14460 isoform X3 n=1 Tax=Panicum hallii TaxID=206008 RepID=UPI000DF4ED5D|nr:putative disease resistance protein At3g14460 isoform X3 [Panicum hallii]